MRRFEYSAHADADLIAIHAYIHDQDPATAVLVVGRIKETVESLCVFPAMGKPIGRDDAWVFGGSGKSPFRITYRFDDEAVTILHIFRAQRRHVQL